jgi:hypothetical protein
MVFLKREAKPSRGFDVVTIMGNKDTTGQVGLEVEVEGNKFPKHAYPNQNAVDPEKIPSVWKSVKDGSLRGADSQEYVLKSPLSFDEVPEAVNSLWKMFNDYGSVLDDSNRTSVHVHVNVQTWHMNRLTTFVAMYYILEEILTEWCGDHRVGNLFCLRAKDAPAIVRHFRNFVRTDGGSSFEQNVHHYAGLNTHALNKYGSLEFRALRGVQEPGPIIEWVSIIRRLYELSAEYDDPRTMVEMFSSEGPFAFFDTLLGDKAHTVRQGISMTDWSLFSPLVVEADPFGREKRTVKQKLTAYLDADVAPAGSSNSSIGSILSYATEEDNDYEPEPEYD